MSNHDFFKATEAKEEVKDEKADIQTKEEEEIPQLVPIATPTKKPKLKVSSLLLCFQNQIKTFQLEYYGLILDFPPPNIFLEIFQEAATGESPQTPCEEAGPKNNKHTDKKSQKDWLQSQKESA